MVNRYNSALQTVATFVDLDCVSTASHLRHTFQQVILKKEGNIQMKTSGKLLSATDSPYWF